ncbi:hypothetical protein [Nostocoides australiense]
MTRDATAVRPRSWFTFVAAAVSLVVAFAASASPIPLYNTYRAHDGLTNADLSLPGWPPVLSWPMSPTRRPSVLCGSHRWS